MVEHAGIIIFAILLDMKIKQLHATNLMSEVVSTINLNTAFKAVCDARKKDHANSDIWDVRFTYDKEKMNLHEDLLQGRYRLSPVEVHRNQNRDWVILTKTREQLRRVVKKMHRMMQDVKFKLALNKTFIGKLSKGFDFLGYHFDADGLLGLASSTIQKAKQRIAELYEQGASNQRIQQYVNRWIGWAKGGLDQFLDGKPEIGEYNHVKQIIVDSIG